MHNQVIGGAGLRGGDALGGAIRNVATAVGSLTVTHSAFIANQASGGTGSDAGFGGNTQGGAIDNDGPTNLTLTSVLMIGNQARGGDGGTGVSGSALVETEKRPYIDSMSTARKLNLISVDDYLASELSSPVKREYLGRVVYAMAGARNAHNRIATNTLVALGIRLRGKRCVPFNSDTKIRVRLPTHVRFYYLYASVICQPNPPTDSYQDDPAALFEVLSRKTRRIDEGEKKDAYLTIPSLGVYALVEQDQPGVVVFRRADGGFVREVYPGLDAVIPLPEIEIELPLREVCEGVEFVREPADYEQD